MTVTDDAEKKFVIKHSFKDVMSMKYGETMNGSVEYHYNIPWRIRISRKGKYLKIFLDCMLPVEWSIEGNVFGKIDRHLMMDSRFCQFDLKHQSFSYATISWTHLNYYTNNGDFVYEFTVLIKKVVTGPDLNFSKKLKNFDDESAKEDSDVTLIVKDQKFHVLKKYLAHHSTYFKTLFSNNFSESEKSIIEVKDINPHDFQYFLEFLYAESSIEAHSVLGILHLADFFDAKTVIRRCQEFLVQKSKLPLKQKFETAVKYNLEELKNKCLSEMKTIADLRSIVPEDSDDFGAKVWKELFMKSLSLNSK